jgi:hypothetical protein
MSEQNKTASIATMVLATSRLAGLTRKKEGFVPFQRSVDRFGGRRAAEPVGVARDLIEARRDRSLRSLVRRLRAGA